MMVKYILKILKISRLDIRCLWNNLYYNFFCKSVIRENKSHLFIYPGVVLSVEKSAVVELHGDLYLGIVSIKGSRKESNFLMRQKSRFVVMQKCEILDSFDIQIHPNGLFKVDLFHSNVNLEVSCGCRIVLDGFVMAGRHVRLKDYNGHKVSFDGYPLSAPIIIKNHVWLCTGATINPGVQIEEGAVVGDNANVITDVPSYSFVAGNPALVISTNIEWSK